MLTLKISIFILIGIIYFHNYQVSRIVLQQHYNRALQMVDIKTKENHSKIVNSECSATVLLLYASPQQNLSQVYFQFASEEEVYRKKKLASHNTRILYIGNLITMKCSNFFFCIFSFFKFKSNLREFKINLNLQKLGEW